MKSKWEYITQADVESRFDFMRRHVLNFSRPARLYHYTTGKNLISIVESGELWTTHVACMNDTKESIYMLEELQKNVSSRLPRMMFSLLWGEKAREVHLPEPLEIRLGSMLGRRQEASFLQPEVQPFFVSCFSAKRDDLSQWRAYSGGEGGYMIEFDADALKNTIQEVSLGRVVYDTKKMRKILTAMVKEVARIYSKSEGAKLARNKNDKDEWAEECVKFWLQTVWHFAVFFKHKSFEAEEEYRLVHILPEDAFATRFLQRDSMMSRHVPLKFEKKLLPIVGVCVGPCKYPELSSIAVGDLLEANGYDRNNIEIWATSTPYRVP